MFTERLADAVAALGRLGNASKADALYRITMIATRRVPGCAGATVAVWRGDEVVESAVSHPDLGALLDREYRMADGPTPEGRRTGELVLVEETMTEGRWSGFGKAAVRCGVRSLIVIPLDTEDVVVTFALYAVRPRVFGEPSVGPVAGLLAHQAVVALGNVEAYESVASEANQMRQALASRSYIEQAKGIVMQARNVDADAAFEELRRVSQRTQTKLSEVARRLVQDYPHNRH